MGDSLLALRLPLDEAKGDSQCASTWLGTMYLPFPLTLAALPLGASSSSVSYSSSSSSSPPVSTEPTCHQNTDQDQQTQSSLQGQRKQRLMYECMRIPISGWGVAGVASVLAFLERVARVLVVASLSIEGVSEGMTIEWATHQMNHLV